MVNFRPNIPPSGTPNPGNQANFIAHSDEARQASKKLRKQGESDSETSKTKAKSQVELSNAARQQLIPEDEKFLETMREELDNLDPDSPDFFEEATENILDNVLSQEFDSKPNQSLGAELMKDKLFQTILDTPQYREAVEDFLDLLYLDKDLSSKPES